MRYKILVLLMLFVFCISYAYETEFPELKNSTTAVGYSFCVTVLPSVPLILCAGFDDGNESLAVGSFILTVSGIVIGPSAGHFYAGNTRRGFMSAGSRAISGGAFILSSGALLGSVNGSRFGNEGTYAVIAIVSGLSTFGSIVFDIWTCPNSVEKYNRSVRDYRGFYLSPEIDIKDESYGLSLSYRF